MRWFSSRSVKNKLFPKLVDGGAGNLLFAVSFVSNAAPKGCRFHQGYTHFFSTPQFFIINF